MLRQRFFSPEIETPNVGNEPVLLSVLGIAWCDVLLFFRRRKRGRRKLAGWRTRSVTVWRRWPRPVLGNISRCVTLTKTTVYQCLVFLKESEEVARLILPLAGAAAHHDVRAA